jgi:outer membrane protein assembly factor BamD
LIRAGHLARADEWYASYRSEHEESRGIPTAIVMLAQAHLRAREYLLTRFYLNEYRRDFPSGQERAGVEYLGLRSLYLQYRSMQDDRIGAAFYAQAKAYRQIFPHSSYRAKVRKLEREMHRIQNKRYRDLARYYARIGKAKAAAIYQAKISDAGEVSSGK